MSRYRRIGALVASVARNLLAEQPSTVGFYSCCGRVVRCAAMGQCTNPQPQA